MSQRSPKSSRANKSAPANRRGRRPYLHSGFTRPTLRSTVAVPAVAELGLTKQESRGVDVVGDLLLERVQRGEGFFVPQLFDKGDFQFLSVEVAAEIEQVRLGAREGLWVVNGGPDADIQHAPMGRSRRARVDGIHAIGRQHDAGGVEVGGGKTE